MTERKKSRLIIVSNRLPFQVAINNGQVQLHESDGGLVSSMKSYLDRSDVAEQFESVLWIGAADFDGSHWACVQNKARENFSFKVEAIFIESDLYERYYNGFCNSTLWPLFHYFPSYVELETKDFEAYVAINQQFADRIVDLLKDDDTLWIHDYHLTLVPMMVRAKRPNAAIGFFLHIPFPSFEIFRLLKKTWKEQLISGMLGADLIGFHTHEYVQHFLKSAQMTCGVGHEFRNILLADRVVKAETFPLGIDFEKFQSATQHPAVLSIKDEIKRNFPDKKMIFSIDRLDYTKGINQRLIAFEHFIEKYPEWRDRIVFIQVVIPSRQFIAKYCERKKTIEEEVGRINGRFSSFKWQPIIYRYSQLTFHELTAMYSAADIGLITPLRDGMNLVAKEFLASKREPGTLIVSELAGCANELNEAILVNPLDKDEVSDAIAYALVENSNSQYQKLKVLHERIKTYTVIDWANDFISQLRIIKENQKKKAKTYFSEVPFTQLLNDYKSATRRALFFDYDGTLVPFVKKPEYAAPDIKLISKLKILCADKKNTVSIVSGRSQSTLQVWFPDPSLDLVSEHGAALRRQNEWISLGSQDESWKEFIRPILEMFSRRCPGAFIEEKNYTLVWHYRNVEHEHGFMRSRELLDALRSIVQNAGLNVIDGSKVIEVRKSGLDKGEVTKHLLTMNNFDFVLAIGDDTTDEDMFKVLDHRCYTIKVGIGHTVAKYYLKSQSEVNKLLDNLVYYSSSINQTAFHH